MTLGNALAVGTGMHALKMAGAARELPGQDGHPTPAPVI